MREKRARRVWGWKEDVTEVFDLGGSLNDKNGDRGIEKTGLCNDEWRNKGFMNTALTKTSKHLSIKSSVFFKVCSATRRTQLLFSLFVVEHVKALQIVFHCCREGEEYAVVIAICL